MKNSLFKNLGFVLLLALIFLAPTVMFGQTPEETTPASIVEWLTPFIVLSVTALFRWLGPKIPGWATMIIVTAVSAAVAWATNAYADSGDMSFIMQTLYGLLAVFLNQLYRQLNGGNAKSKKVTS